MDDTSLKESLQNAISTKQMYKEYNWFSSTFPETVQQAYDDFFTPNFRLELIGISKNINCLLSTESCFVTKVKIDYEYDMFFRLTESAVEIILNKVLGQSKYRFNINKISDLESRVITAFNDFAYGYIKKHFSEPPSNELKRVNFDLIHLTFIIQDVDDFNKKTGKVIVTLPAALLNPEPVVSTGEKFAETDFPNQHTEVSLYVGKTKFSLYDLKHLEIDDVVVFEDSELERMDLSVSGEVLPVSLNPNMDLLITDEQEEESEMTGPDKNIWDSIEVEMVASFDSVKITLGELKDIEDGLVVDLASLYDNNVTLKVEDKSIASGNLVIVNDRYGVKINKVIAEADDVSVPRQKPAPQTSEEPEQKEEGEYEEQGEEYNDEEYDENEETEEQNAEGEEEEFDYSDFDLEDDNI